MKNLSIVFLACLLLAGGGNIARGAEIIQVKGSTTVLPVSEACSQIFMQDHPGVKIHVHGGGSGRGISALISGDCDIADASRPIEAREIELAINKGVEPTAHVIGLDAIAVIVHPSNPLSKLTSRQLKDIFTGKITDWSEVTGYKKGWILVVSRDAESGTFSTFTELALDKAEVTPEALQKASNQEVASTVEGKANSIGYVGLGYVSNRVKAVSINGVSAAKETARSGEYPFPEPC